MFTRIVLVRSHGICFFVYPSHTFIAWSPIFTTAPLQRCLVYLVCFSSRCEVLGGLSAMLCVFWFFLQVCTYETPVKLLYGRAKEIANKVQTTALHVCTLQHKDARLETLLSIGTISIQTQKHNFTVGLSRCFTHVTLRWSQATQKGKQHWIQNHPQMLGDSCVISIHTIKPKSTHHLGDGVIFMSSQKMLKLWIAAGGFANIKSFEYQVWVALGIACCVLIIGQKLLGMLRNWAEKQ